MNKFYQASIEDYFDLLKLIVEFELDKLSNYDQEEKIDQAKMLQKLKKDVKSYLNDRTYNYIVCKHNDDLIAYIFLSIADLYEGEGYINEVYVCPTERKKGIANKLVEKGISWLKKNKCKTIDLTVNRKNKAALRLYKNYGFGKFEDSYISMRKKI